MSEFDENFLDAVREELARARHKFPEQSRLTTALALVEEVGELAQAILQGAPESRVEAEAVQVAVMALRVVNDTV